MTSRWSPAASTSPPVGRTRPSTTKPSGRSSAGTPIFRKPVTSAVMRSLSFTRSSLAPETSSAPPSAARAASTGSSSMRLGTSSALNHGREMVVVHDVEAAHGLAGRFAGDFNVDPRAHALEGAQEAQPVRIEQRRPRCATRRAGQSRRRGRPDRRRGRVARHGERPGGRGRRLAAVDRRNCPVGPHAETERWKSAFRMIPCSQRLADNGGAAAPRGRPAGWRS